MHHDRLSLVSGRSALFGFLLAVPFFVMNFIANRMIEPFYSWLDPVGPFVLGAVLSLGFIGAGAAAAPLFRKDENGRRKFYIVNALIAFALFAFFAVITVTLGEEIYRCDVLGIPNCD